MKRSNDRCLCRSSLGPRLFQYYYVAVALAYWGEAGTGLTLIAGAVYFVGMFVCTIVFNVPLNKSLARLDPNSDNADQTWFRYLKTWTSWNHLRTVSSLITYVLCIWLLSIHFTFC
jgi:uncharacterized membrane protein